MTQNDKLTPALQAAQEKMRKQDPNFDVVDYILQAYNVRGMSMQEIANTLPGIRLSGLIYGLGRLGYQVESKLRRA